MFTSRMFREPAIEDIRSTRDFYIITRRVFTGFDYLPFHGFAMIFFVVVNVMIYEDTKEATMAPRDTS